MNLVFAAYAHASDGEGSQLRRVMPSLAICPLLFILIHTLSVKGIL